MIAHRPSPERVGHFIEQNLERHIDPSQIWEVYPVVKNNLVFRYGEHTVTKIRPEKTPEARQKAIIEIENLRTLQTLYNERGYIFLTPVTISEVNGFMVIDMPYLGENVGHLVQDLDRREFGEKVEESAFAGFGRNYAERLITQLRSDLEIFANRYGYMHGDLFHQGEGPNNIVYNKDLDRLLVIDVEDLINLNDGSLRREQKQDIQKNAWKQLNQATDWILKNMVVEEAA